MLEISRKSWHYAFARRAAADRVWVSRNLCGYCWQVLLGLAAFVIAATIISGWALLTLLSFHAVAFVGPIDVTNTMGLILSGVFAITVAVIGVAVTVGVITAFCHAVRWALRRLDSKVVYSREPSWLETRLEDWRQRRCSMIRFQD